MAAITLSPSETARFWSLIDRGEPDACWPWKPTQVTRGYGKFWDRGLKQRHAAHRLAWMLTSGEIPAGMLCCHRCDNPPCCNPAHIFLGTHLDNAADSVRKERHSAHLTAAQAIEARKLYAEYWSCERLGERFGVAVAIVRAVIDGKTWKHLPPTPQRAPIGDYMQRAMDQYLAENKP